MLVLPGGSFTPFPSPSMKPPSLTGARILPGFTADELDELLDHAGEALFVLDGQGRVLYANDRAVASSTRSRDDLLGRRLAEAHPALSGPSLAACIREVRTRQTASEIDVDDATNGGPLSCRVVPLRGGVGVWASAPDEQAPAAEPEATPPDARHRDRELLDRLIDTIPVMITIWDPDVQTVRINRAFEDVLGWTSVDMQDGDPMTRFYPDADYREEVRTFMTTLEPGWREFEVTAKNGEKVWSSWANISLSDDRRVGIGIDLRQQRRAERALRDLNASLEERVEQRTAALEKSNRELQQFAYVASHDLQEPIRKIRTFADLLLSDHGDALDEEPSMFLDRIQDAAARMQGLLADLLDYSRVITRSQPFQIVDLHDLVGDALLHFDEDSGAADIRVAIDAGLRVEADVHQLREALAQLIHNALKFQRDGVRSRLTITATVDEAADDETRRFCRIVVADNGVGFDASRYGGRIFEPFEQLHGRGRYAGTGMGLAICRRIVERHGGTITAESTPDEGSRFIVRLPLRHE